MMLTGYGNIATAVAAVKAGAIDYLLEARRCGRCGKSPARETGRAPRPAGQSDVRRPGALGAHPARL